MSKPDLKLVDKQPLAIPFDDTKAKKIIESLRDKLLSAAVRYVKDGKDGSLGDRLRIASDRSGIPLNQIEIEAGRG